MSEGGIAVQHSDLVAPGKLQVRNESNAKFFAFARNGAGAAYPVDLSKFDGVVDLAPGVYTVEGPFETQTVEIRAGRETLVTVP